MPDSPDGDSGAFDIERLLAQGIVCQVEHHALLASTQDRAQELAAGDQKLLLPLVVLADAQTAGRGRGANRWWTGPGSLAFSLVFDPESWGLARRAHPLRSLAAAVALVDTIAAIGAPFGPALRGLGLHWPNDVFVGGRKIAGILIDVLPDGRHVLGIGVNVNNSLAGAPEEVLRRATTLRELTGRTFDRTEFLMLLLAELETALRETGVDPDSLGKRCHDLCLQVGETLTIESGGQRTRGLCRGIASDGALLLETPAGSQKFYSGVLQHG